MTTLNLQNFSSLNVVAQSKLDGDVAAGASSAKLQSNDGFAAGPILLGAPGQNSELATITAPSNATDLPISGTTTLPHNSGEPAYMLYGDQLRIYTAADQYGTGQQPDDANFVLLTTIDIDGGRASTAYDDNVSASGTWYKYTYYNSVSHDESALADSRAYQSGQVHYVSVDQVRRAAGFSDSPNVTDDVIAEKRDAAEREINGALLSVYSFPLPQPTNPIIQQIALNIAAGELQAEMYQGISQAMVKSGEAMADMARHGGGRFTSLDELATREVVLSDANFLDLATETGHGFNGYPDENTTNADGSQGPYFTHDEEY